MNDKRKLFLGILTFTLFPLFCQTIVLPLSKYYLYKLYFAFDVNLYCLFENMFIAKK